MNIGGEILSKCGGDPVRPRLPRRGSRLTGFVMMLVGTLFVAGLTMIAAPINLFVRDAHDRPVAAWMAWPPLSRVQEWGPVRSWLWASSGSARRFVLIDHWVDVLFDPPAKPAPFEHREDYTPMSRALGVTLLLLCVAAIAMAFRWGWLGFLHAAPRPAAGTGGPGTSGGAGP
ncbi:MAG: hypothetical protein FJ260_06300 [Planctomycetes bacterium]|nr:hypothetical protein [Planctomycetota bacterium]